ncbi:MAG TPA: glycosyltransferase [Pyrinomonadaceae bacterium]|nr:glycosyltransferase [Pyrinomonadaceae bacterium]
MKILHVIPSVSERSGGPATAIVPMCRALMQQGIEVFLLSTTDGLPEIREVAEYKGVPAMFFPSKLGASFKYSRPLATWLSSNVKNFDLAHIHAVFNHSSVAASQACRKAGVPYVIRPLGTLDPWSMTQKSLRKGLFWQFSGKAMLRGASAVHYTSEVEKLSTERHLNLNHGKVISLGIDAHNSNSNGRMFSEPYVLVLSRLHPKKAVDVLIEAFQSLIQSETFARWRLVIAGDGPADYVSKLKAQVAATDRIVFTGWLDEDKKHEVLGGAALLALPSHQENFGLCVMEALSHSVPVLVSPNVNLATEIVSANAGWISAIDKDALATRLAEALSDQDELMKRGLAGRELSQKYSWENAATGLINLYTEILDGRK